MFFPLRTRLFPAGGVWCRGCVVRVVVVCGGGGLKIDFFAAQGAIKCTLLPASRKSVYCATGETKIYFSSLINRTSKINVFSVSHMIFLFQGAKKWICLSRTEP